MHEITGTINFKSLDDSYFLSFSCLPQLPPIACISQLLVFCGPFISSLQLYYVLCTTPSRSKAIFWFTITWYLLPMSLIVFSHASQPAPGPHALVLSAASGTIKKMICCRLLSNFLNFFFKRNTYLGSSERALSLLEGHGEVARPTTQALTSAKLQPPLDQEEAGTWPLTFPCPDGKQSKVSVIKSWSWFLVFLTQSWWLGQQRTKNATYEADSTAL